MSNYTARRALALMAMSQAQKEVTYNQLAIALDVMIGGVDSQSTTAPPSSPSDGNAYIIPSGATGVWSTHVDDVAYWYQGSWVYLDPTVFVGGLPLYVIDDDVYVKYVLGSPNAWDVVAFGGATVAYFTDLLDVPSSYSGAALQAVRVNAGGTALEFYSPATGTGDVVGPASATDGYAALFDGTTGKLIKAASAAPILTTAIGVTVQAYSAVLAAIVGLSPSNDDFLQRKSGAWANRTIAQVLADLQGTGSDASTAGFRGVPQNSQSADYTCVLADAGKHIFHPSADTTARTYTIPANASVAYPIGTALTFINQNGAGTITIAITSDTMRLAGAGTTGSRTLAANGIATALKITSTAWLISGTGLT